MAEPEPSQPRRFDLRAAVAAMQVLLSRHGNRRRALAALAKIHGFRLERRRPFLIRDRGPALDLDDLLELEYVRRRRPLRVLCVGAFDATTNDRLGSFVRSHTCVGTFVEPQPHVFERLRRELGGVSGIRAVNAAVDRVGGKRTLYYVEPQAPGLPEWTQQLASFDREHVLRHETETMRLSPWIRSIETDVLSFAELLVGALARRLDVLQLDTEGHDSALLSAFPLDRMKPGLLHFEIAHMEATQRHSHCEGLVRLGYWLLGSIDRRDLMALRV